MLVNLLDKVNGLKSYKEGLAFQKHNTPVITLTSKEGKDYSFILDSGCSVNAIDAKFAKNFNLKEQNEVIKIVGVDGNPHKANKVKASLYYNGVKFTDEYIVKDFNNAFAPVEADLGITICGLLGTDFMNKHNINLDFKTGNIYV